MPTRRPWRSCDALTIEFERVCYCTIGVNPLDIPADNAAQNAIIIEVQNFFFDFLFSANFVCIHEKIVAHSFESFVIHVLDNELNVVRLEFSELGVGHVVGVGVNCHEFLVSFESDCAGVSHQKGLVQLSR